MGVNPGTATNRAVLDVLAWHRNDRSGECFPAYKTIAKTACCDRKTVMRAIGSLEGLGLIRVIKAEGKRGKNGTQASNRYILMMEPEQSPTAPPCDSVPSCPEQSPTVSRAESHCVPSRVPQRHPNLQVNLEVNREMNDDDAREPFSPPWESFDREQLSGLLNLEGPDGRQRIEDYWRQDHGGKAHKWQAIEPYYDRCWRDSRGYGGVFTDPRLTLLESVTRNGTVNASWTAEQVSRFEGFPIGTDWEAVASELATPADHYRKPWARFLERFPIPEGHAYLEVARWFQFRRLHYNKRLEEVCGP